MKNKERERRKRESAQRRESQTCPFWILYC